MKDRKPQRLKENKSQTEKDGLAARKSQKYEQKKNSSLAHLHWQRMNYSVFTLVSLWEPISPLMVSINYVWIS